jgi:hypothetical protein
VLDSAVASHAFTFGGLDGTGNLALQDTAMNTVALLAASRLPSVTIRIALGDGLFSHAATIILSRLPSVGRVGQAPHEQDVPGLCVTDQEQEGMIGTEYPIVMNPWLDRLYALFDPVSERYQGPDFRELQLEPGESFEVIGLPCNVFLASARNRTSVASIVGPPRGAGA